MRRRAPVPGGADQLLVRPLLDWRRRELEKVCEDAGVAPALDPGNEDQKHERVRVRRAIAGSDWLDVGGVARSADHLAAADEALDWAVAREWSEFVEVGVDEIVYRASTAPAEIIRRIVGTVIEQLATEGSPDDLRGRELDRLIRNLQGSRTTTLRGVRCSGGLDWRFRQAKPRTTVRPSLN